MTPDMFKSEAQIYLQNGLDGQPQQHNASMEQGKVGSAGGGREGRGESRPYALCRGLVALGDEADMARGSNATSL